MNRYKTGRRQNTERRGRSRRDLATPQDPEEDAHRSEGPQDTDQVERHGQLSSLSQMVQVVQERQHHHGTGDDRQGSFQARPLARSDLSTPPGSR